MKLAEEKYEKPFFPPILQWFPIYRGETRAGELLGAFEMLQVFSINSVNSTKHIFDIKFREKFQNIKICISYSMQTSFGSSQFVNLLEIKSAKNFFVAGEKALLKKLHEMISLLGV